MSDELAMERRIEDLEDELAQAKARIAELEADSLTCYEIFEDWHVMDPWIRGELMPRLRSHVKPAAPAESGEGGKEE